MFEAKTKFRYRFNNYKSKHRAFRKGNLKIRQKHFHNHYCLDGYLGIDDWHFTLFEQCETYKQLKETETFWQQRLETFYPLGLNQKEEYLYLSKFGLVLVLSTFSLSIYSSLCVSLRVCINLVVLNLRY